MRVRRMIAWTLVGLAVSVVAWLGTGCPVYYGELAEARVEPDTGGAPGARVERVTLVTTSGRELDCLAHMAPGLQGRQPAIVVAGGQRTGRRSALLAGAGYPGLSVACEYGWAPLLRRNSLAFVLGMPRLRAELIATPQMLAVLGAYLSSRADADTARVSAIGASLGVPFVAAWAAADPLPRAVALVYGGAGLGSLAAANLLRTNTPRWLALPAGWLLGAALRPLEPAHTTPRIAPRRVLVVGATADERIPRAAIEALVAAARPQRVVWFGGAHMHPSNEELLRMIGDTVRTWLTGDR